MTAGNPMVLTRPTVLCLSVGRCYIPPAWGRLRMKTSVAIAPEGWQSGRMRRS